LNHTARRIREGEARIDRTLAVIEGLIDHGLMDQEQFSKAFAVLTTLHDSQTLLEQLHRRMSEAVSLETRRPF
jgi:methylphosphotriester-DNA--protein-cysteine methyltransferase